ncbi:hypothetical protein EJB05_21820, partial [Eragrostis curvula]
MTAIKAILQVIIFAFTIFMFATHEALGEHDCYHEKENVKVKCKKNLDIVSPYVRPRAGSKCCRTVRESDMVCVCRTLTRAEEDEISAVKLVDVADDCGKPVPVGNKCGTWTVPPPLPPPHARTYKSSSV